MSLETSVILPLLVSAAVILLLSGALFLPLLAFAFRAAESIVKKTFFNNMSRQVATAGFICGLIFVLLAAGAVYLAVLGEPEHYQAALNTGLVSGRALHLVCGLLAGLLVLQLLHLVFWKKLRKAAALQLLILAAVITACFSAMIFFLCFLRDIGYMPESAGLIVPCIWFSNALNGLTFPLDIYRTAAFAASAAAAGALGICWLLLRRNADDFGRDYYNFAVSRCSGITLIFGVIAMLLGAIKTGIGISLLTEYSFDILAFPLAVTALQVVSCIIWLLAFKSRSPLRQKAGLWLCLPLWAISCVLPILL